MTPSRTGSLARRTASSSSSRGPAVSAVRRNPPESTVAEATSLQTAVERDGTIGAPVRYGLGFFLGGTPFDNYGPLAPGRVFGHGGLGSSVSWADPETGLAFSYVTNGVRDPYEHRARVNELGAAARRAF
jgi:CubicO group peptidase (beta-lactamase class C family)